jgi:glycosyltransferase involved in cell wall biosynthesis
MARRKVVHLVEDLEIGGLERVIASIALGLDRAKYEVEVWCLVRGGEIAEELANKGVAVKVLGMDSYHNPLQVLALLHLIRKENAHILHTHGYFGNTFGRLAAILAKTHVIIAHVHTPYSSFKKRNIMMERFLSLFTDKIVCVSQAVKRFVVEVEGINEKKTSLIYNGVGEPRLFEMDSYEPVNRKSLGISDKDFVVITVASLTPHKGHRVLIDAARVVTKSYENVRFLIAGDGPLRNELESYTKEAGLSSKVVFTGQRKDIATLLSLGDFFVLPSIEREGLGIALIEAMAAGLPVIGTRLGGIPEVIEDRVNGLLVAPGNAGELATAIEKLASDRSMKAKMGMNGKQLYELKFTADKMTWEIEFLYEDLLRRRLR